MKGTSHWISAAHAVPAEFRLYDRLFTKPNPDEGEGFLSNLNPQSLEKISGYIESGMAGAPVGSHYQFERQGYFCVDPDSRSRERWFSTAAFRSRIPGRRSNLNRSLSLTQIGVGVGVGIGVGFSFDSIRPRYRSRPRPRCLSDTGIWHYI